uniref:Uncharacterized protein n=1 Tax=Romanomermis culicivorax TaxID=13658 RepID=A0A915I6N7_ROMCU
MRIYGLLRTTARIVDNVRIRIDRLKWINEKFQNDAGRMKISSGTCAIDYQCNVTHIEDSQQPNEIQFSEIRSNLL